MATISVGWLPRQGKPQGAAQRAVHKMIRLLAHLPVYTAVIVTLTLVLVWFTR